MNPHRVSKTVAQQRAKVEVARESLFRRLPTLAEMRAKPRAVPKIPTFALDHGAPVKPSKALATLARAKAKQKTKGADRKKLYRWALQVKKRDDWTDRYDGKPVLKSAEAHPRRAESHHITPRADKAVRYDIRNGITLSLENHARVEGGQLQIIGIKHFTVAGTRYIDATAPVKFIEVTL